MVVMALLNCLQRPEDPGGFAQAHGDAATTAVLFWENKCRMVLKELDAAHVVSQVMVRDYTTAHAQAQHALREKERESEEWQQKLARAQSKIESLEAERERWLEDKAHGRKQLHESEQQWKSEKGNLQREVQQQSELVARLRSQVVESGQEAQRWKWRAEGAVRQLQTTQERARAAFTRAAARYRALQQQHQEQQHPPAETSDQGVQAELAPRSLSRAVQCEPARRHAATETPRPARLLHRGTCTDVLGAVVRVEVGVQGSVGGAGDPAADLLQQSMIPAAEPPSPSQEVPTENLLDVSVERLDELLRPHQDHQEPSQPREEELDPAVGGMEDLQGVLTAVRARLVSALECHLAQRSRLSCVATQTDTPATGFDDHLERTPLPSTGDEYECMQVDVEDDDREGAQEEVQRRSQETQVCLVEVQLQHDGQHDQRVALQRSQGTQADNGPQRDPIAHHLQCTLALERHALARLSRSLTGMAPGSLRRCPLKRLFRPRAAPGQGTRRGPRRGAESWTPRDCSPLKRLFRTRPAPGKGTRRRPRRGAESWTPRDCRRLRGWVRRHIWRTLEDLASPASTVPSTPTLHHVARIRRHCARAARSRAALQLQVAQLSAQLQEGEDERRCARGHIEFLQRRLQQLIHCSAVTARDLAALRSVHDKLTGELTGAKQLPGLCRDQDDDGLAAESKGSSDEGAKTASSRGGGDRKDSIDQGDDRKRLDEQLDHTPSKLVECEPPAPEERELAELDARVCQVVRGLRGCSSGCSGPGAECLMLLRVVPLLARQLLLERRRTASAASPRATQHPLAPPNTPREALSTPSSPPRLQRALSRECAARLQAQSLAHQHHLHVVRAEHHKHVQSLNAAHLQTVGKLMDQHVVALSRAREQLRAEVRAEVQRELRRDMRAVVARSTADLEALHQAELNSLLRSSSDPGQRAPQWAPQCEGSGMPVSASETGLSDKNPHQLKKWLEIHEAEVVKQAASLALHSMDVGAAGDYVIAHATDSNAPPGGNISTPKLSSNRMSAWHSYG